MRFPANLRQPWLCLERSAMWIGIIAVVIALILGLSSCATYEAVTSAPPDFWTTLTGIGKALMQDIGSLLKMIF